MKRLFFVIFMVVISMYVKAANDKFFTKLIREHDVPKCARLVDHSESLEVFWDSVLCNNIILSNLAIDLEKQKGAEKDALASVNRMTLRNYKLDVNIIDDYKGLCDSISMLMGLTNRNFELNVIDEVGSNAFCTPTKEGFAICLTSGLFSLLNYDLDRIMGVIAHEYAHGALLHHLRHEYAFEKEKRKNTIIGAIAAGVTAAGNVAEAYTAGLWGREIDHKSNKEDYEQIANRVVSNTIKFKYKYGREQEYEADLVAFRFLERLGKEDKYSEALQLISTDSEYFWYSDPESDHPATIDRLEFLEFVKNHPELENAVKKKTPKTK